MFNSLGKQISLSKKIEIEIENAIRTGKLSAGTKIPTEKELCDQFSVSRTAVREAISKLSARGLIYVKKGSGTYVNEISFDNVRRSLDLFFELSTAPDLTLDTISARQLIEPNIAALAAKVRTQEHIDLLKKNMDEMIACPVGEIEREAELDNSFHSTIIKSTNNEVIILLMQPVYSLISKYRNEVFAKGEATASKEDKKVLVQFHQAVYEAIRDQDPVKARENMSQHLKKSKSNYLKLLKRK